MCTQTLRKSYCCCCLSTKDINSDYHVGFVISKAKVAPQAGTTIPRKELCAAILAVEIAQFAIEQLDIQIFAITVTLR